jgi:CDP-paratose 2-epimerase
MRILITGACGFVGSTLAIELTRALPGVGIVGLDNLSRPGSERNRHLVASLGVQLYHGDIRNPSDLEPLPSVDWVIDAAANPSVLAGISGPTSSRQLVEHNLVGRLICWSSARPLAPDSSCSARAVCIPSPVSPASRWR